MTKVNARTHVGIRCYFRVEKYNANGVVQSIGPFKNKVLNCGLDAMRKYSLTGGDRILTRYCNVGTGSSTPAASQTGLDSHVASAHYYSVEDSYEADDPFRGSETRRYDFNIGKFDGDNLTELGVSAENNDTYLNRQLMRVTTAVTDETIATGDGSTKNFTESLANDACDPDTLSITAYDSSDTLMTVTDDGDGNLTGDGSGTVLYDTGAIDVTFDSAPKDDGDINANYEWQEPTTITVADDEGLRVFCQVIQYHMGEKDVYNANGSFTFEDLYEETSETISVETKVHTSFDSFPSGDFHALYHGDPYDKYDDTDPSFYGYAILNLFDDTDSNEEEPDSTSRSFTGAADGGPYVDIEGTWNPDTFTHDIGYLQCHVRHQAWKHKFDPVITDIKDTEELKFTARISWGEY